MSNNPDSEVNISNLKTESFIRIAKSIQSKPYAEQVIQKLLEFDGTDSPDSKPNTNMKAIITSLENSVVYGKSTTFIDMLAQQVVVPDSYTNFSKVQGDSANNGDTLRGFCSLGGHQNLLRIVGLHIHHTYFSAGEKCYGNLITFLNTLDELVDETVQIPPSFKEVKSMSKGDRNEIPYLEHWGPQELVEFLHMNPDVRKKLFTDYSSEIRELILGAKEKTDQYSRKLQNAFQKKIDILNSLPDMSNQNYTRWFMLYHSQHNMSLFKSLGENTHIGHIARNYKNGLSQKDKIKLGFYMATHLFVDKMAWLYNTITDIRNKDIQLGELEGIQYYQDILSSQPEHRKIMLAQVAQIVSFKDKESSLRSAALDKIILTYMNPADFYREFAKLTENRNKTKYIERGELKYLKESLSHSLGPRIGDPGENIQYAMSRLATIEAARVYIPVLVKLIRKNHRGNAGVRSHPRESYILAEDFEQKIRTETGVEITDDLPEIVRKVQYSFGGSKTLNTFRSRFQRKLNTDTMYLLVNTILQKDLARYYTERRESFDGTDHLQKIENIARIDRELLPQHWFSAGLDKDNIPELLRAIHEACDMELLYVTPFERDSIELLDEKFKEVTQVLERIPKLYKGKSKMIYRQLREKHKGCIVYVNDWNLEDVPDLTKWGFYPKYEPSYRFKPVNIFRIINPNQDTGWLEEVEYTAAKLKPHIRFVVNYLR